MVQILFFLSLLCITAIMLRLFWYLDDSHEEEIRINLMRYRHGILHTQESPYTGMSNSSYKFSGYDRTDIIIANKQVTNRDSSVSRQVNFNDVGTASGMDNISSSARQTECA